MAVKSKYWRVRIEAANGSTSVAGLGEFALYDGATKLSGGPLSEFFLWDWVRSLQCGRRKPYNGLA